MHVHPQISLLVVIAKMNVMKLASPVVKTQLKYSKYHAREPL